MKILKDELPVMEAEAKGSVLPAGTGVLRRKNIFNDFKAYEGKNQRVYISPKYKLFISSAFAVLWLAACVYISTPWIRDLGKIFGMPLAVFIVTGLAFIPGVANVFVIAGLFADRRPEFILNEDHLPPISILVAAYNEEKNIEETLRSIIDQDYPNNLEVIVVDDGSRDETAAKVKKFRELSAAPKNRVNIKLVSLKKNSGKAAALNEGLRQAVYDFIVTLDADSYLYKHSLLHLVNYMVNSSPDTAAVAGAVMVRNSRKNWITKLQEWDYFHGIAVVKRIQSLYQGTLVAQGSFSIFRKEALVEAGGWTETMGEDIVLTWYLHKKRYKIGYAETAIIFTNVPESYKRFFRQRKRWARGLIEAFKRHPKVLFQMRLISPFVWYNALFPILDFVFAFVFIPGVLAAVIWHNYAIVGLMTLILYPLAFLINGIMFYKQKKIFAKTGLKVRHNLFGFIAYMFTYQILMVPATIAGYAAEFFNMKKSW
jgi:poly-beta-1,6-N-acetyl-D-glucosamine synthase